MSRTLRIVTGVVSSVLGAALWWRAHPSACPYGQRFWVETPHPFITRARLHEALRPAPRETNFGVGPDTGLSRHRDAARFYAG